RPGPMRTLILSLLAALLAACSSSSLGGGDGRPVLVNRTGNAVLYAAFNLSEAPLVDPNPALDPAEAPERLVAAGDQRPLAIVDYEGGGVLLFIYEIPATDRAGPVPLSRTIRLTREELARMNNRIVLDEP
ncbi:MAG TPA: hypothetical protein VK358_05335, partial [Longimicrobium sp.]|nr:hypothetical protein [Longimicrobium sp.]